MLELIKREVIMNKYSHTYSIILDNMDMQEYRLRPISTIMYIQDTFARYCGTKRVAAYDLFSENLIWVVGEFNIEFVDILPFWSEEIKVNLWISEVTKLKIYVDYEVTYKNKPFAKGNSCWFLLNDKTKRPVRTDDVASKFEICEDLTLGEHKKFLLESEKDKISEINHKNNLSDIDFNDHVNNKSYLNIANVSMDKEFKRVHSLKSLYIRFNKETFLGDILNCATYNSEKSNIFIHKITKDGISICDIQSSWEESPKDNVKIKDYDLSVKLV